MLYCPNGHGEKNGQFCDECGAALGAQPPGDSLRIRSPQASAAVQQSIFLPGAHPPAVPPVLVKCPRCGRRNREDQVFDCQGECGRENLCLRHFDEAYDVCVDCARALRQEDRKRAEAEAALRRELAEWKQRAEAAQTRVAELTRQLEAGREAQGELEQTLEAARQEAARLQAEVARLEKELAGWKKRAEQAEGELAAIRRREEEERAAAERARQAAQEQPIWQQIGIELIRVPAGPFLYGDKKAKVYLDEFWIAKTPVTNLQYKAFVDATGHEPPTDWEDGRIPAGKEHHPVVCVSWFDAVAFCEWAGVRLPREQEWEKAARGTDGREYPWGDEPPTPALCNFNQNVGDTTPVGSYPEGASPYGCLDMAGNVWEWCADWYTVNKSRVLRGGSWWNDAERVRCACRNWSNPYSRYDNGGFRVVGVGAPPAL